MITKGKKTTRSGVEQIADEVQGVDAGVHIEKIKDTDLVELFGAQSNPPVSKGLKMRLTVDKIDRALREQNEEELVRELSALELPLEKNQEDFLINKVLDSDWPLGFEKVFGHLGLDRHHLFDIFGHDKLLVVEAALETTGHVLAQYLWPKLSEKEKEDLLDSYMNLKMARLLVNLGEEERLLVRRSEPTREVDQEVMLRNSIRVMGASDPDQSTGTAGIIKTLLSKGAKSLPRVFWSTVMETDNIELVKFLLKNGTLKESLCKIQASMAELCGSQALEEVEWNKKMDPSMVREKEFGWEWTPKGKKEREFSLAEAACFYSTGGHSIVGHLVLNKAFRSQLEASTFARNALIIGTACRPEGAEIFAELKAQGVNLKEFIGFGGVTPLHAAAEFYNGADIRGQTEAISALIDMCPQWLYAKDSEGRLPVDRVGRGNAKDLFIALAEGVELTLSVERGIEERKNKKAQAELVVVGHVRHKHRV